MEKLVWVLSLLRSLALVVSHFRGGGSAVSGTVREMAAVVRAAALAGMVQARRGEPLYGGAQGAEVLAMAQMAVLNIVRRMEEGNSEAAGGHAEELAWALAGVEEASLPYLHARLSQAQERSFLTVWVPLARPATPRSPFVGAGPINPR